MIIFDVGHYPYPGDPGAFNKTFEIREHDFCFNLAQSCRYFALVNGYFDALIVTRKTTLQEVCERINRYSPKFVLSFHFNGFHNTSVSGTECFYWYGSQKSQYAAELLQKNMTLALNLTNRGAKSSGLYQLGAVKAPIVLIEPGFLTNDNDVKRIMDRYQVLVEGLVWACRAIMLTV